MTHLPKILNDQVITMVGAWRGGQTLDGDKLRHLAYAFPITRKERGQMVEGTFLDQNSLATLLATANGVPTRKRTDSATHTLKAGLTLLIQGAKIGNIGSWKAGVLAINEAPDTPEGRLRVAMSELMALSE